MAFTPETGTGITGANAAIEVAYADDYHATRNNVAWERLTEAAKQGAIVNATDFIFRNYSFDGIPFKTTQGLHFPIFDLDGETALTPDKFKDAVAELAFVAKDRPLITRTAQDRGWLIEDSQGPLVKRWAPGEGTPSTVISFDWLDQMLAGITIEGDTDITYVERA